MYTYVYIYIYNNIYIYSGINGLRNYAKFIAHKAIIYIRMCAILSTCICKKSHLYNILFFIYTLNITYYNILKYNHKLINKIIKYNIILKINYLIDYGMSK